MPIRREHRFFYPIDWPQLSAVIRFWRAGGRPHGRMVYHLGDGRWWDIDNAAWRDVRVRRIRRQPGSVSLQSRRDRRRPVGSMSHEARSSHPSWGAGFIGLGFPPNP
jgi:hypothetical protein